MILLLVLGVRGDEITSVLFEGDIFMSGIKKKAWGFIVACAFFMVSLVYPCYTVVVELEIGDPYIRMIRIGSRLIGILLFLLGAWGILAAYNGRWKMVIVPAATIVVIMFVTLVYLYSDSQDFSGIFLVFEDFLGHYIDDIATSKTTHLTGGFFFNVITTIAVGATGYLLYSAEE